MAKQSGSNSTAVRLLQISYADQSILQAKYAANKGLR
jgi:hypothetical protein